MVARTAGIDRNEEITSRVAGVSSRVFRGVDGDVRVEGGRLVDSRHLQRSVDVLAQDVPVVGRLYVPTLFAAVVRAGRQASRRHETGSTGTPGRQTRQSPGDAGGSCRGCRRQGFVALLSTGRPSAAV